LVGRAPNKRLEPEANRISVRLRAGCGSGLTQQVLVDVQSLLHPYDHAISVWLPQARERHIRSRCAAKIRRSDTFVLLIGNDTYTKTEFVQPEVEGRLKRAVG
jgi:hypothetical protein